MNADTLLENFEILAEAPGGIDRLRELILKMAVSGKLVEQSADDGDAGELVPKYVANQKLMTDDGVIGTQRFQRGSNSPQLPYHIPKNWRWHYLGDVGAIIGGGTPSSSVSSYWSDHDAVPWLTPADMRKLSSRYVMRGRRDITPKGLTESSAQLLPRGAVLFSSRAPIGHVAIAAQPLATNQGFKSCVPYIADMSEYIYFFLLQIGPQVDANATGTTFKEVSGKQVAQILIPVPPLAEQRRIVAKVDELMALCDQLELQQKHRDNLRTATRKSAIDAISTATTPEELEAAWERINNNWEVIADTPESVDALRKLILSLATKGKLLSKTERKTNPSNGLPETWVLTPFKEIAHFGMGKTPPTKNPEFWGASNSIMWISISDMKDGETIFQSNKTISLKAKKEVFRREPWPIGTLLMSFKLTIGKMSRLGCPAFFNEAIFAFDSGNKITNEFLFRVLPLISSQANSKGAIKGSTLNSESIGQMQVPIPPIDEQKLIVEKVDELMAFCDQLESELKSRSEVAEKFARSVVNAA